MDKRAGLRVDFGVSETPKKEMPLDSKGSTADAFLKRGALVSESVKVALKSSMPFSTLGLFPISP